MRPSSQRLKSRGSPLDAHSARARDTRLRPGVKVLCWQRGNDDFVRPARDGLIGHQLRRVTAFIEDHLAREIGLVRLAELVGLSPWHFCRALPPRMEP
jgi:hypothetical protein